MTRIITLLLTLLVSCRAFITPNDQVVRNAKIAVEEHGSKILQATTTIAIAVSASPLVAMAEAVVDDYEYGAVNAPIGLAWGAGVLAIITAAVPVLLSGGEDAFNEMKEQDSATWGTGRTDALSGRKNSKGKKPPVGRGKKPPAKKRFGK
mmetsp:Transcript_20155/g.23011  ORF Transcript_20155/g.23011 Transcript_20155/m.23011 type:complete len:150 (-) Transcript_20155:81-530(-)